MCPNQAQTVTSSPTLPSLLLSTPAAVPFQSAHPKPTDHPSKKKNHASWEMRRRRYNSPRDGKNTHYTKKGLYCTTCIVVDGNTTTANKPGVSRAITAWTHRNAMKASA